MTKKLNWRLSKLPDSHEVIALIANKIITQEEAREILFSLETTEDRDKKSLESEIKFLRELVDKLSSKINHGYTTVIETIREVEKPWRKYPWYEPYVWWSTTSGINANSFTTTNNLNSGISSSTVTLDTNKAFSSIKTF